MMKPYSSVFAAFILISPLVASAQEQSENSREATADVAVPPADPVPTAPVSVQDTPAKSDIQDATANAKAEAVAKATASDPNAQDVGSDRSLAALGVGVYGRGSDAFVLWDNPETGGYVKPIIWVSTGLLGYFPSREGATFSDRAATMLVSRFGFEGALNSWASFKVEFQRDLGFSISSSGPQGTGVYEGTASLQARENYINLHRWGLSLIGGIQTDPASVDFISSHVLGLFGMDPFTRDYLLQAGFNLGQGLMARYEDPFLKKIGAGRLVYGFQFTSGNPLTTSLSYGFGGSVTVNGTLFTGPLRGITNGVPGTNILLTTYSPSLTYEVDFAKNIGFDLRASAQIYRVDVDTVSPTDARLNGTNFRGSARIRLPYVNLMGGYARRVNQQLALPDITTRRGDNYEGTIWSAGAEINYGRYGVGAHYASVKQEYFENSSNTAKYFNVGASYQLVPGFLWTSLRYSSVANDYENVAAIPTDAKMVAGTLSLTI